MKIRYVISYHEYGSVSPKFCVPLRIIFKIHWFINYKDFNDLVNIGTTSNYNIF